MVIMKPISSILKKIASVWIVEPDGVSSNGEPNTPVTNISIHSLSMDCRPFYKKNHLRRFGRKRKFHWGSNGRITSLPYKGNDMNCQRRSKRRPTSISKYQENTKTLAESDDNGRPFSQDAVERTMQVQTHSTDRNHTGIRKRHLNFLQPLALPTRTHPSGRIYPFQPWVPYLERNYPKMQHPYRYRPYFRKRYVSALTSYTQEGHKSPTENWDRNREYNPNVDSSQRSPKKGYSPYYQRIDRKMTLDIVSTESVRLSYSAVDINFQSNIITGSTLIPKRKKDVGKLEESDDSANKERIEVADRERKAHQKGGISGVDNRSIDMKDAICVKPVDVEKHQLETTTGDVMHGGKRNVSNFDAGEKLKGRSADGVKCSSTKDMVKLSGTKYTNAEIVPNEFVSPTNDQKGKILNPTKHRNMVKKRTFTAKNTSKLSLGTGDDSSQQHFYNYAQLPYSKELHKKFFLKRIFKSEFSRKLKLSDNNGRETESVCSELLSILLNHLMWPISSILELFKANSPARNNEIADSSSNEETRTPAIKKNAADVSSNAEEKDQEIKLLKNKEDKDQFVSRAVENCLVQAQAPPMAVSLKYSQPLVLPTQSHGEDCSLYYQQNDQKRFIRKGKLDFISTESATILSYNAVDMTSQRSSVTGSTFIAKRRNNTESSAESDEIGNMEKIELYDRENKSYQTDTISGTGIDMEYAICVLSVNSALNANQIDTMLVNADESVDMNNILFPNELETIELVGERETDSLSATDEESSDMNNMPVANSKELETDGHVVGERETDSLSATDEESPDMNNMPVANSKELETNGHVVGERETDRLSATDEESADISNATCVLLVSNSNVENHELQGPSNVIWEHEEDEKSNILIVGAVESVENIESHPEDYFKKSSIDDESAQYLLEISCCGPLRKSKYRRDGSKSKIFISNHKRYLKYKTSNSVSLGQETGLTRMNRNKRNMLNGIQKSKEQNCPEKVHELAWINSVEEHNCPEKDYELACINSIEEHNALARNTSRHSPSMVYSLYYQQNYQRRYHRKRKFDWICVESTTILAYNGNSERSSKRSKRDINCQRSSKRSSSFVLKFQKRTEMLVESDDNVLKETIEFVYEEYTSFQTDYGEKSVDMKNANCVRPVSNLIAENDILEISSNVIHEGKEDGKRNILTVDAAESTEDHLTDHSKLFYTDCLAEYLVETSSSHLFQKSKYEGEGIKSEYYRLQHKEYSIHKNRDDIRLGQASGSTGINRNNLKMLNRIRKSKNSRSKNKTVRANSLMNRLSRLMKSRNSFHKKFKVYTCSRINKLEVMCSNEEHGTPDEVKCINSIEKHNPLAMSTYWQCPSMDYRPLFQQSDQRRLDRKRKFDCCSLETVKRLSYSGNGIRSQGKSKRSSTFSSNRQERKAMVESDEIGLCKTTEVADEENNNSLNTNHTDSISSTGDDSFDTKNANCVMSVNNSSTKNQELEKISNDRNDGEKRNNLNFDAAESRENSNGHETDVIQNASTDSITEHSLKISSSVLISDEAC